MYCRFVQCIFFCAERSLRRKIWKLQADCAIMIEMMLCAGSAPARKEKVETECFVEHGALIWSKF